jgi:hypothetical protein
MPPAATFGNYIQQKLHSNLDGYVRIPFTLIFTRTARELVQNKGRGPLLNKAGHTIFTETILTDVHCGFQ